MGIVYMEIGSLFTGYLSDCSIPHSFYHNLYNHISVPTTGDVLPVSEALDTRLQCGVLLAMKREQLGGLVPNHTYFITSEAPHI